MTNSEKLSSMEPVQPSLAELAPAKQQCLRTGAAWLVSTQGVDRQAILLVTFTNKAAGEMKQRIRGYVQDAKITERWHVP